MSEKKVKTVRLSTVILLFIIFALIIGLCEMYYLGFAGKKEEKNISNEIVAENIEKTEENEVEKVVEDKYIITYSEESFTSYNSEGQKSNVNKRNVPTVKNEANQTAASKIEKSLKTISDKNWNYIKESSEEFKDIPYENCGINYIISTDSITENYIVFRIIQDGSFGGSSWDQVELYNYDAKTGEKLTLKSIAKDYEKLIDIIYNEIEEYIEEKEVDVQVENQIETIEKLIETDGNWGLTENGLEVNLPKYSIASGADGIISVEINKSVISQYINDNIF